MVTCKKTDWAKGCGVPMPVNEAVATEVLDYLFNTQTWKQHPDALILKVRRWRERLWLPTPPDQPPAEETVALGVPAAATTEAEGESWSERAVRLRAEGQSWNQIARDVNKPVGTVRDAIRRAAA